MLICDLASRIIRVKVVYFGCAMSGKTTSLRTLFEKMGDPDQLKSIETQEGRTLFFDCGTIDLESMGWKVKVDLWSATGQDFYNETRPTVLTGTDGVVFVADSTKNLVQYNLESWNELNKLIERNLENIPIVISLNKRDLKDIISVDEFKGKMGLNGNFPLFETIAINGTNILQAFHYLLRAILKPKPKQME